MTTRRRMAARLRWTAAIATVAAAGCTSSAPSGPSTPALSLTCPAAVGVGSQNGSPVTVTFDAPTASGGKQPVTTRCSPLSGSSFPLGATNVTCQASDATGATANCSFTVSVRLPPGLQYTRYLAFGDSVTEGGTSDPVPQVVAPRLLTPEPYPLGVQRRLTAVYPQQTIQVINAGVTGELAYEGGVRRFRGVLVANQPEVVLLMEGSNDISTPSGMDPGIAALDTMVQEALAQGRRVAIATIPPQRPDGIRRRALIAARVDPFNERIRALADTRHIPLVEVHNAMTVSMIGFDDVHPTAQGYSVISDTFAEAIRRNFDRTP
jgi:lysophospholipase L1-like esterase